MPKHSANSILNKFFTTSQKTIVTFSLTETANGLTFKATQLYGTTHINLRPPQAICQDRITIVNDLVDELDELTLEITPQGDIKLVKLAPNINYIFDTPFSIINDQHHIHDSVQLIMSCSALYNDTGILSFNRLQIIPYSSTLRIFNEKGIIYGIQSLDIKATHLDNNCGIIKLDTNTLHIHARKLVNINGKIFGANVIIKSNLILCRNGTIAAQHNGQSTIITKRLMLYMLSSINAFNDPKLTKIHAQKIVTDETCKIGCMQSTTNIAANRFYHEGTLLSHTIHVHGLFNNDNPNITCARSHTNHAYRSGEFNSSAFAINYVGGKNVVIHFPKTYTHNLIYGNRHLEIIWPNKHIVLTDELSNTRIGGKHYKFNDSALFYCDKHFTRLPLQEHYEPNTTRILASSITFAKDLSICGTKLILTCMPPTNTQVTPNKIYVYLNNNDLQYAFKNSQGIVIRRNIALSEYEELEQIKHILRFSEKPTLPQHMVNVLLNAITKQTPPTKRIVFEAFDSNTIAHAAINVNANLYTTHMIVDFTGYRLQQKEKITLGSYTENGVINLNVQELLLFGNLGPQGIFKTTQELQHWHINEDIWQSNIALHLTLLLHKDWEPKTPINLQALTIKGIYKDIQRLPITFKHDMIIKTYACLEFTNCNVNFGDPAYGNSNFTLFCALAGQLLISANEIKIHHASLFGEDLLHLHSTHEPLIIGSSMQRTKGAQIRGKNGRLESCKEITTYHTYFDFTGKILVKASMPWIGYGCEYFTEGETTLDVPNMQQSMLISDHQNLWGVCSKTEPLSEQPAFISLKGIRLVPQNSYINIIGGHIYAEHVTGGRDKDPITTESCSTFYRNYSWRRSHPKHNWEIVYHGEPIYTIYTASFGSKTLEFKHKEITLSSHIRTNTLTATGFTNMLIGSLANICVGIKKQWVPILNIGEGRLSNRALQASLPGTGTTVFQDVLTKHLPQPQFLLPRLEVNTNGELCLTSGLRSLLPIYDESRKITLDFLKHIGQLPPEYKTNTMDFLKIHKYLTQNSIELFHSQQEHLTTPISINNIDSTQIKKPILLYMQTNYAHANGIIENICVPKIIMPDNYRVLHLEHAGGSLCVEVLKLLGDQNSFVHITHKVHASKNAYINATKALLETRMHTWDQVVKQVHHRSNLFRKKTHVTESVINCSLVEQIAELSSSKKLVVDVKELKQVGAILGDKNGTTKLIAEKHTMLPLTGVNLRSYNSSAHTFFSNKSIAGQLPIYHLVPSIIKGSSINSKLSSIEYVGAQIYATNKDIQLLVKSTTNIKEAIVTQTLPPTVTKQAKLLILNQGSIQESLPSSFVALHGKVNITCNGIHYSRGTNYKALQQIYIRALSVHEDAAILHRDLKNKVSGITGLQVINQDIHIKQTVTQSTTFTTGLKGQVLLESTGGAITLVSPQIATKKFIALGATDVSITPAQTKRAINTLTRSYGIGGFCANEMTLILRNDYKTAIHEMLRSISSFASLEDLLEANDWADRIATATKFGYHLYKLNKRLRKNTNIWQTFTDQINTTINVRAGKNKVIREIQDAQLSCLEAQNISIKAQRNLTLIGIAHNVITKTLQMTANNLAILGTLEKCNSEKIDKGMSLSVNVFKKKKGKQGISISMDGELYKKRTSKWSPTCFSNLENLAIHSKEVRIIAAKLKSNHATVISENFLVQEEIDHIHEHAFSGQIGITFHPKISPDFQLKTKIIRGTKLNTPSGIETTDTFLINSGKVYLTGGSLSAGTKATPILIKNMQGENVIRYKHPIFIKTYPHYHMLRKIINNPNNLAMLTHCKINLIVYNNTPTSTEPPQAYITDPTFRTIEVLREAKHNIKLLLTSPGELYATILQHIDLQCKTRFFSNRINIGTFLDFDYKITAKTGTARATIAGIKTVANANSNPNNNLHLAQKQEENHNHWRGLLPQECVKKCYKHFAKKHRTTLQLYQPNKKIALLEDPLANTTNNSATLTIKKNQLSKAKWLSLYRRARLGEKSQEISNWQQSNRNILNQLLITKQPKAPTTQFSIGNLILTMLGIGSANASEEITSPNLNVSMLQLFLIGSGKAFTTNIQYFHEIFLPHGDSPSCLKKLGFHTMNKQEYEEECAFYLSTPAGKSYTAKSGEILTNLLLAYTLKQSHKIFLTYIRKKIDTSLIESKLFLEYKKWQQKLQTKMKLPISPKEPTRPTGSATETTPENKTWHFQLEIHKNSAKDYSFQARIYGNNRQENNSNFTTIDGPNQQRLHGQSKNKKCLTTTSKKPNI